MHGDVILHDAATRQWLAFQTPRVICQADRLDEVLPQLRRVEALVGQGLHAAGFLSYEAAPAFDPALTAQPPADFPLLWFGLYAPPAVIQLPPPEADRLAQAPDAWTPSVTPPAYTAAIAAIKDHIARGDTYQVNYTLRLRAPFTDDPWALFLRLADAQRADYGAYLDLGRWVIASASPELFFRLTGSHLEARPMKGTAARGRTLAEDEAQAAWLSASAKNRAENVMIVDMLRNDLGRVADLGSVAVPALFTLERYPTVWQMTSTVTAQTSAAFTDIFRALFPCASITGAPKPRTMRLIRNLESGPRRLYTGAIGYLAPQQAGRPRQAQFNVAIRTVVVDRSSGQAEYGVGGGIVWDSDADDEYAEALLKANVLRRSRQTFELLETLRWDAASGFMLLDRHLARLRDSAAYFGFRLDVADVQRRLAEQTALLGASAHRLRVLVAEAGAVRVEAYPLAEAEAGPVRLRLAPQPVDSADVFLYHKTTRRQVYEAARAACPDADEVVLWNERGELTETTIGNLAACLDDEWVTPPVTCGLLPGTYRAHLLAEGRLRERVLTREDMQRVRAWAVVNSVRLWRPAQWLAS